MSNSVYIANLVTSTPKAITLTLGSASPYVAKRSQAFSVTDSAALTTSKIAIHPAPDSDEYEMQTISCSAYCATNGTITVFITSDAPLRGNYNFFYTVS